MSERIEVAHEGTTTVGAVPIFGVESIRRAVEFTDLIEPIATALAEYSLGRGAAPIVVFAPAGGEGDVHVKSAWLPERPIFTVKVATWFSARARAGQSASSGFIAVHDATTGDLLALLQDGHHLTDLRTAAAGAAATKLLARENANTLAVLGTGVQAYLQTLAVCAVRPIDTVVIWGRRADAAHDLREALAARAPHLQVSVADQAQDAVAKADVIVTATSAREPILYGSWLRPGQHITAVGADDETKRELDASCFTRADLLVVDSRQDTPRLAGDLRYAISSGARTPADVDAEVGELVLGRHPGRQSDTQVTIAKLIGLGVQDLAAAEIALRHLLPIAGPAQATPASGHGLASGTEQDEESQR